MKRVACLAGLMLTLTVHAQDTRHPLTRAIAYDANLLLVADLRPDQRLVLDLHTAARTARSLAGNCETQEGQAAAARVEDFKKQARALALGDTVDEKTAKAISVYHGQQRMARQRLLAGVDSLITQLRRSLSPEQERLINWSRPPEVSTAGDGNPEAVTDDLRDLLADLSETLRVLERIRYSIVTDYAATRVTRLSEFLRAYMDPDTPEFRDGMDFLLRLSEEMRLVPEEQWREQAPLYASRVLQYLGVLEPEQGQETANAAPYGWWDLYNLLTDEQTPQMLEQILATMPGNPGE